MKNIEVGYVLQYKDKYVRLIDFKHKNETMILIYLVKSLDEAKLYMDAVKFEHLYDKYKDEKQIKCFYDSYEEIDRKLFKTIKIKKEIKIDVLEEL